MVITDCMYFIGKIGQKLELVSVSMVGGIPWSGGGRSAVTLQLVPQAGVCGESLALNAPYQC